MRSSEKELVRKLEMARDRKQTERQIEVLTELGYDARQHDELSKAKGYYAQAAELAASKENYFEESYAQRGLCEICAEEGNRSLALEHASHFVKSAQLSRNVGQIQLSYHVVAWVYEKLWVVQSNDSTDLEKALTYCAKSVKYLREHANELDNDKQAVESGGDTAARKANLERLAAGINANLGKRLEAERFWNSAYAYAERKSDSELMYNLLLAKMDFQWEDLETVAKKLYAIAPPKMKVAALSELAQAKIGARKFTEAFDLLLNCYLKCKSQRGGLPDSDKEILQRSLVLLYRYMERRRTLDENSGLSREKKRRLNEKIADDFCEFASGRKNIYIIALEYYERMLELSEFNQERLPAYVSLAETYKDIQNYDESLKYLEKAYELEKSLRKGEMKLIETEVEMFIVRCRANRVPFGELVGEMRQLCQKLTDNFQRLKINIYKELAKVARNRGEAVKAEQLERRARDVEKAHEGEDSDDSSSESGEDNEEEAITPCDRLSDDRILDKCIELAERRAEQREIEEDRDKAKNAVGETRLHLAAKEGDTKMLQRLIEAGYNINARDNAGWTPLSEAVSHGHREAVALLLKYKARVDCASDESLTNDENETGAHITPLMEACELGYFEIARLLLQSGASVVKQSETGKTAVDFLRDTLCKMRATDRRMDDATRLLNYMEELQRKRGVLSSSIKSSPSLSSLPRPSILSPSSSAGSTGNSAHRYSPYSRPSHK